MKKITNCFRRILVSILVMMGMYLWGTNATYGQPITTPKAVTVPRAKMSVGSSHVLHLMSNGSLWAWGGNNYGQLGSDSTATSRVEPKQIGTDSDWAVISAGGCDSLVSDALGGHSLAIKTNGTLWAWGRNDYGQVGDGTTTHRRVPVQIGTDLTWAVISAGGNHTLAIKANGTLWAWGRNEYGQVGDGTTTHRRVPVQIGTDSTWTVISAGGNHSLAIKKDGTLWAWGKNDKGQLGGYDSLKVISLPVQIGIDKDWKQISAGYSHTWALKTDSTLRAWGDNSFLETKIDTAAGKKWEYITSGSCYSLAIDSDGKLWACGNNSYGQFGNRTRVDKNSLIRVRGVSNFWQVAAGGWSSIILLEDEWNQATWCGVGFNRYGQLGNYTTDDADRFYCFPQPHGGSGLSVNKTGGCAPIRLVYKNEVEYFDLERDSFVVHGIGGYERVLNPGDSIVFDIGHSGEDTHIVVDLVLYQWGEPVALLDEVETIIWGDSNPIILYPDTVVKVGEEVRIECPYTYYGMGVDFGDGYICGAAYQCSHAYDTAGIYHVKVSVNSGCANTVRYVIHVIDPDSTAKSGCLAEDNQSAKSHLLQNHPNPAQDLTIIEYVLAPDATHAKIVLSGLTNGVIKEYPVYDIGKSSIEIGVRDLPAGIYSYSLTVDGKKVDVKKLILIK